MAATKFICGQNMKDKTCGFAEWSKEKRTMVRCGKQAVCSVKSGRIFDGLCMEHLENAITETSECLEEYVGHTGKVATRYISARGLLGYIREGNK